jgi:imidazolonepropionase-like amidohydrolase
MKLTERFPEPNTGESRRDFLKASVGTVASISAAQFLSSCVSAQEQIVQDQPGDAAQDLRAAHTSGRPILLRNGIIHSVDPQVGDFAPGDLLIRGKTIEAVGQGLQAPGDSLVVDARAMIIMPGVVDTHHHHSLYENQ